ncbi:helix-turn-helix transcriptional regulator [Inquilinus limosus]|uniref:winged helix-turn-helix transcriptional regulator n=1 Tax=Inquilinus limosus TaxID=171674 RepID=UPI003F18A7F7
MLSGIMASLRSGGDPTTQCPPRLLQDLEWARLPGRRKIAGREGAIAVRSYNQFCPVAKAAEIFCERWTALILRDLAVGATRFSDLQRGVPLASPTLLSQRLKQLQAEGIVIRRRSNDGRSWTYHLSKAGEEFIPIVMALGVWGQRWSRRELAEHEKDLGLLLWALEKGAHPECLGDGRTVIELEFTDQPDAKRRWWFLNENGRCELCLKRPDRDAQIYVAVSLPDLIRIWRGDLALSAAMASGLIEVHGSARMRKAFRHWLGISGLADVRSERIDAADAVASGQAGADESERPEIR